MVSFIDQSVQEKLRVQGIDVTLKKAGIHGTKNLKTEKVPIKIKGLCIQIEMCIQPKRLHTRQSPLETQTRTTTS